MLFYAEIVNNDTVNILYDTSTAAHFDIEAFAKGKVTAMSGRA